MLGDESFLKYFLGQEKWVDARSDFKDYSHRTQKKRPFLSKKKEVGGRAFEANEDDLPSSPDKVLSEKDQMALFLATEGLERGHSKVPEKKGKGRPKGSKNQPKMPGRPIDGDQLSLF